MSIGDAWGSSMGSMNKEASLKLLDAFVEAGGNFIDTANGYQVGFVRPVLLRDSHKPSRMNRARSGLASGCISEAFEINS
jgi:aryl-alcohol dehydrogenase-like predicted oxidoreductase